jgi:hypothetical protein
MESRLPIPLVTMPFPLASFTLPVISRPRLRFGLGFGLGRRDPRSEIKALASVLHVLPLVAMLVMPITIGHRVIRHTQRPHKNHRRD